MLDLVFRSFSFKKADTGTSDIQFFITTFDSEKTNIDTPDKIFVVFSIFGEK